MVRASLVLLRYFVIINFEIGISEVIFRSWIVYKVDDIIENFFDRLLECINHYLCVFEHSWHLLVFIQILQWRPVHFHCRDDTVDHV